MDASEIASIITNADIVVGYEPMPDEPDFRAFFSSQDLRTPDTNIPPTTDIPPEELVARYTKEYSGEKVVLLIPGQKFDAAGTRHGRGGGWYDRFLATAPKEWVRVGVAREAQVHADLLHRASWDQPIDYLLIKKEDGWGALSFGERQGMIE